MAPVGRKQTQTNCQTRRPKQHNLWPEWLFYSETQWIRPSMGIPEPNIPYTFRVIMQNTQSPWRCDIVLAFLIPNHPVPTNLRRRPSGLGHLGGLERHPPAEKPRTGQKNIKTPDSVWPIQHSVANGICCQLCVFVDWIGSTGEWKQRVHLMTETDLNPEKNETDTA